MKPSYSPVACYGVTLFVNSSLFDSIRGVTLADKTAPGARARVFPYRRTHAGDAIVAATATENNLILVTSNAKHFRPIKDLKLKAFKP